ncbi:MAG: cell envelope integrity protein TolA [Ruminococcus sp.]|nr:cell envelope integrity protein TolA [Ruminococcus sp.]
MKDNEKDIPQAQENNDDKVHVSKSVFQTAKDIQQQRLEAMAKQEEEMQRKLAEREKKRKEAYDRKILEEKKELLRLKQGAVEESEIIHEEAPEEIKLTLWQKIKNFFYHNKWWLWMGVFFVFVAGFLIHDLVTKDNPDINIMVLTKNDYIGYSQKLEEYTESFSEDFNDDGETMATIMYIPYTENLQSNYAFGVDTNLSVQLQSADSMIFIGGDLITDIISPEETLVDLEELYPDNPNVDGYKFYLKNSAFAERLGISEELITDDLFLAIRKPIAVMNADAEEMQAAYDKDFPVFEKIIEDICK